MIRGIARGVGPQQSWTYESVKEDHNSKEC